MDKPSEFACSVNLHLLQQSVRIDDHGSAVREAEKIIRQGRIDWNELYELADAHCIKPQLMHLIAGLDDKLVPGTLRDRLNGICQKNILVQLGYTAEFLKVRQLLETDGIPIVPFKGFWLAHDAYGNLGDRESGDVDVFIYLKDLGKIKSLMEVNGYLPEATVSMLTIEEAKRTNQEYNFDRLVDGKSVFHIEFHWGMCPPRYGMNIRLEDLASRTMKGAIQEQEILVFTPSAHFLLLMLHHGGDDRFNTLKQISDIARLLGKHEDIDWKWVVDEAKRFDAEKLIYVGVVLAKKLAGAVIPDEIRTKVESEHIDRLAKNRIKWLVKPPSLWYKTPYNFDNWLFRLRSRTGIRNRIRLTFASGSRVLSKFMKRKLRCLEV